MPTHTNKKNNRQQAYRQHPNSLVKMRYRKGWDLRTLAEKSKIAEFTLVKIELGTMDMSAANMLKFAKLFDCSVEELLKPCRLSRTPSISKKRQNRGLAFGRGRLRWGGRLPVPKSAHPLVKELIKIMNTHKLTLKDVASKSGVEARTISHWRYNRSPSLLNFEAALNSIGYKLKIVRQQTHD